MMGPRLQSVQEGCDTAGLMDEGKAEGSGGKEPGTG